MPALEEARISAARPRLVRLAYRMLGSVADAEDVVQDALVRYQRAETDVHEPEAFLARTVTRLCLDALKSARARRETYVGPWLPEPILDDAQEVSDDVTLTLMCALERLSPLERAAFLLHDVFGVGLDEVAVALDREPAACRKLASRARVHVQAARPRFPVSERRGQELAQAFFVASRAGDVGALKALLASDVVMYSDGGGKRSAATRPVAGVDRVSQFFAGLARKEARGPSPSVPHPSQPYRPARIDGLPGFVTHDPAGIPQTTALAIEADQIVMIYIVRNPDKLRRLAGPATPARENSPPAR